MRFRVNAVLEGPFRSAGAAKDYSVAITWADHVDQEILWSWTRKSGRTLAVGRTYSVSNRLGDRIRNA